MTRPLPRPTAETQPFWDGCASGQLRYQQCRHCGTVQLIPRSLCAACHQVNLEWKTSRGLGRILSHTTVHRAPTPAFRDAVPYVLAIVDMEEGFRLMAQVKDGVATGVSIGQPVRIGFEQVETMSLPRAEVIA